MRVLSPANAPPVRFRHDREPTYTRMRAFMAELAAESGGADATAHRVAAPKTPRTEEKAEL